MTRPDKENLSYKRRETTIAIAVEDKARLDKLKVHRREPYRDVVRRVLDQIEKTGGLRGPQYIRGLIDSVVGREHSGTES